MLISEYDKFVQRTDQTTEYSTSERVDIAIFGVAAEIGSVVAAVKKKLLVRAGPKTLSTADDEIIEELGDVIWYCFSLARISNPDRPVNIFAHDISNLKREIGADDARAARIQSVLDPSKRDDFLRAAEQFPRRTRRMEFEDYQDLAFLTARTSDRTLVEVCLAVLWQLSAQLLRQKLPAIELELNQGVADRPINDVIGEIAWHVSALASIFGLRLSDVAEANVAKVSDRWDRSHKTAIHDAKFAVSEQIPRRFEIAFVSIGLGRSRMYLDGRRVGNDLTDNAYGDDGYRYHDIMHLANSAKLSWSPVLRGMLGRKRKSDPRTDEVEDGARAQIVEEAVIKAIHSEGVRLANQRWRVDQIGPARLFPTSGEISFRFLKSIRGLADDLEVSANRLWEWEAAILDGYEIFHRLRCEGQGTVAVDLEARSIGFVPEVFVDVNGRVAGLGSSKLRSDRVGLDWYLTDVSENERAMSGSDHSELLRIAAQKRAILDALDIRDPTAEILSQLRITELREGQRLSVKASGAVQKAMWDRQVIGFRTSLVCDPSEVHVSAIAISDD